MIRNAIEVRSVSKRYVLGEGSTGGRTERALHLSLPWQVRRTGEGRGADVSGVTARVEVR